MPQCNNCAQYGISFSAGYSPAEFIEGDPYSPVWIIGLNPKGIANFIDNRTAQNLKNYFRGGSNVHAYFRDFEKVSRVIYRNLGGPNGVAHTDLVKCFSMTFPPKGVTPTGKHQIINTCGIYLSVQIGKYQPGMLVCNGADICKKIQQIVVPQHPIGSNTSYLGRIGDREIIVVLSGFIGRIDNYSKHRLGREIESLLMLHHIHLPL